MGRANQTRLGGPPQARARRRNLGRPVHERRHWGEAKWIRGISQALMARHTPPRRYLAVRPPERDLGRWDDEAIRSSCRAGARAGVALMGQESDRSCSSGSSNATTATSPVSSSRTAVRWGWHSTASRTTTRSHDGTRRCREATVTRCLGLRTSSGLGSGRVSAGAQRVRHRGGRTMAPGCIQLSKGISLPGPGSSACSASPAVQDSAAGVRAG
jgi:hypothetical protein